MATKSKKIEIASDVAFEVTEYSSYLTIWCRINDKRFHPRYGSVSGNDILMFLDVINFAIMLSKKYHKQIEVKANFSLIVCVYYKTDENVTLTFIRKDTAEKGDYNYEYSPEYTFTNKVASNMAEIQGFLKKIEDVYSKRDELRAQIDENNN